MDFIRFVPRRYAVISGRLGTAMDFIRFVPRRYAVISGRLGTSLRQKSMEYKGWEAASYA